VGFSNAAVVVLGAVVVTVNATVPLVVPELSVTAEVLTGAQLAPSPPVAVLLVSWQVSVTVPVYPATAATVTVAVDDAPGATVAGLTVIAGLERVKVDSVTVTVVVLLADW
jgi:hypothetical protein